MKITKLTLSFFLFFLISIFVANKVFSQVNLNSKEYYLTLNKPGIKKRIRFYIGEELKFKLKGEDFKRTATITAIDSNSITINGLAKIPLEEFKMIHVRKNGYFANLSRTAQASGTGGGILFMALGGLGTVLGVGEANTMLVGGGVLFITGQIFSIFTKRNYKLNSYRYLRSVPKGEGLDLDRKRSY